MNLDQRIELINDLAAQVAREMPDRPRQELAWRIALDSKSLRSQETIERLERERLEKAVA